eukprot:TRINITY_DN33959_c0_g2_i1.p1 TRINITY_DN33959_c0_g2~~TRINITY_DN33959_c0_g2_i1.p1  ORF type:complete len:793 (+),score=61.45 TRINITY_DN33959_c0_g2_i1:148-2526(+)
MGLPTVLLEKVEDDAERDVEEEDGGLEWYSHRLATLSGHGKAITSVAFDPSGRRVAIGANDAVVTVWQMEESVPNGTAWSQVASLEGLHGRLLTVAFFPDSRRIMAATKHGVVVWQEDPQCSTTWRQSAPIDLPSDGEQIQGRHVLGTRSVRLSPDGQRIVARVCIKRPGEKGDSDSDDHMNVVGMGIVWQVDEVNLSTWHRAAVIAAASENAGHGRHVVDWCYADAVFSPSGRRILLASGIQSNTYFMVGRKNRFMEFSGAAITWQLDTDGRWRKQLIPSKKCPHCHRHKVVFVAMTKDEWQLVTILDTREACFWTWDIRRERYVSEVETCFNYCCKDLSSGCQTQAYTAIFSPWDGQIAYTCADGSVKVWQMSSTPKPQLQAVMNGTSVAFSPNGQQLLIGSADGSATLWQAGAEGSASWSQVGGIEGQSMPSPWPNMVISDSKDSHTSAPVPPLVAQRLLRIAQCIQADEQHVGWDGFGSMPTLSFRSGLTGGLFVRDTSRCFSDMPPASIRVSGLPALNFHYMSPGSYPCLAPLMIQGPRFPVIEKLEIRSQDFRLTSDARDGSTRLMDFLGNIRFSVRSLDISGTSFGGQLYGRDAASMPQLQTLNVSSCKITSIHANWIMGRIVDARGSSYFIYSNSDNELPFPIYPNLSFCENISYCAYVIKPSQIGLDKDCLDCPSGFDCSGVGKKLQDAVVCPFYWRPSNTNQTAYPCEKYVPKRCLSDSSWEDAEAPPCQGGAFEGMCRLGHEGAKCRMCAPSYFKSSGVMRATQYRLYRATFQALISRAHV